VGVGCGLKLRVDIQEIIRRGFENGSRVYLDLGRNFDIVFGGGRPFLSIITAAAARSGA